ncbi:methyltransferase [Shewanella sp. Choline-02u-19]|uniref:methyltransferase n=1 Tax=unclassified Shewanella TaxID=196818 RepID=UPI000C31E45E|nr:MULTISPECIES: methyltransferase [unclassified Shewanella]PKH54195.1 methyltransferase [Shewanella sp. Bg11-22]PKI28166.1 methyltransferase [Shewanella sp. Choline-02u-19]
MQQHNSPRSAFATQFKQLDSLLNLSRTLWQNRSFECRELPWGDAFPTLARSVWQIADDELDTIDACQLSLSERLLPSLKQDLQAAGSDWDLNLLLPEIAAAISTEPAEIIPSLNDVSTGSFNDESIWPLALLQANDMAHFSAHIKGRKWQQITAFVEHLPDTKLPVLEWCAGKGHLGRLIAKATGRSVVSLEWQQSLCAAGEQFADKWQLPQRFVCADAFAEQQGQLEEQQLAVALHACGDLHVTLLQHASNAGTRQVVISPCCYHLIQAQYYQPLSMTAKTSDLLLTRADLQLPLQQSMIASAKGNQYRLQEMAWRLGFDSLQREMRQVDEYLPIPSIKQSQLNGEFETFSRWAADTKKVPLIDSIDWAHYQANGRERQRLTRRIDLVAHLFRSVFEKWLLLDRVCFLEESGYQVKLSEFCSNSITPRNAIISAFK